MMCDGGRETLIAAPFPEHAPWTRQAGFQDLVDKSLSSPSMRPGGRQQMDPVPKAEPVCSWGHPPFLPLPLPAAYLSSPRHSTTL